MHKKEESLRRARDANALSKIKPRTATDEGAGTTTPSLFRIGTSLKVGPNGEVLRVNVYERICADHECLANTFLLDLQCLPALKAEIDRVFSMATRDGRFDMEDDR